MTLDLKPESITAMPISVSLGIELLPTSLDFSNSSACFCPMLSTHLTVNAPSYRLPVISPITSTLKVASFLGNSIYFPFTGLYFGAY